MSAPPSQSIGSPQPTSTPPRLPSKLSQFWRRVTEGMELAQLWSQFRSDARASYRLYSRDVKPGDPGQTRRRRFFHTLRQFAWAILEKLTPARRVLLLLAILLLVMPAGGCRYRGENGEVVMASLDLRFYGGVLMFIVLILEVADRVVMKRDLEIARDIQRWLLPPSPPPVPGVTIAFATRPANTVAGDYYDVFARPSRTEGESHFLFTVADVAGKSIPAALLMATFQASLKTLSATSATLEELVMAMNRYACSNSQGGLRFTTAFLAEFDPHSRAFTYINAGHNLPVLQRNSGVVERLDAGGLPLGIQAEARYESGRVILETGDWLAVFTDGLVEAVNAHDEEYGETRMLNVLHASAAVSPDRVLSRMMTDVDIFVSTTPQHDDITCLLIKVG